MKPLSFLRIWAFVLLTAGCSKQEIEPVRPRVQISQIQLPTFGDPSNTDGALPPPSQSNRGGEGPAARQAVPNEAVLLIRDSEQADALADYSEKVYIQWNKALKQFRSKERRLPASLSELQKFQPKLASLPAPKGFQLYLDPQLGEINVLRAAQSRPTR